jgi:hypothetical protein
MPSATETPLNRFFAAALCLVFAALCTACPQSTTNPIAPGAEGTVSLGAGVQPSDGVSLELRFYPSNCALPDTLFPGDCEPFEGYESASLLVSTVQFPYTFSLGPEGVGATSQQEWYVMAWLAGTMGASAPEPGEYYGITPVLLNDCTDRCRVPCYCGRIHYVDVLIDTMFE